MYSTLLILDNWPSEATQLNHTYFNLYIRKINKIVNEIIVWVKKNPNITFYLNNNLVKNTDTNK